MRYLLPIGVVCTLALGSAFAIAQPAARPGVHTVALPKASSGAKQVQSTTLLETPHLKLVSIVIPKSGVLPAHSDAVQVSIQALSGTGELRIGERSERLDATHAVVLAPGMEHEVRAGSDTDLVLLVHHVAVGPKGTGPGMGGGGPGMGGGGPGMGGGGPGMGGGGPGMGERGPGMGGRGPGVGPGPRRGGGVIPDASVKK
jgi:quercetin dioxygenase-like cupin family protein